VTAAQRTRLDRESRRAQLVELGVEMLSIRPLDEVVVDDIAAAAGISRGLLFHYFPTKRDYLVAVVQAAADGLVRVTEPDPTLAPLDQLRSSLDAYVAYVEANRPSFVALVRGAVGSDPQLLAVFEATRERIYLQVARGLGLHDDPPPVIRMLIRGWIAFIEELTASWIVDAPTDGSGPAGTLDREAFVTLLERSLVQLLELARDEPLTPPRRP
jgi:AcrR family transcriptional regulator